MSSNKINRTELSKMSLFTSAATFLIKSFSYDVIISANITKHETKSFVLVGQGRLFVLM